MMIQDAQDSGLVMDFVNNIAESRVASFYGLRTTYARK